MGLFDFVGDIWDDLTGKSAAEQQTNAANAAAGISQQAADKQIALMEKIYNQSRSDQEPWREAGKTALSIMSDPNMFGALAPQTNSPAPKAFIPNQLAAYGEAMPTAYQGDGRAFTMSDYQADPGYAFRLAEGNKALERSAAAKGGLLSGGLLKGIADFSQGLASEEYSNAYDRYRKNQETKNQVGQQGYQNRMANYTTGLDDYNQRNKYNNTAGQQGYSNQMTEFDTDMRNYNNSRETIYNRLAGAAGFGQAANNANQQSGTSYGSGVSNILGSNADTQGNAQLAIGNANAGAAGGWVNALGTGAKIASFFM